MKRVLLTLVAAFAHLKLFRRSRIPGAVGRRHLLVDPASAALLASCLSCRVIIIRAHGELSALGVGVAEAP
jgi:hypothetical protein